MEMLKVHSHNAVELNDRTLWFDGTSTFPASTIVNEIAAICNMGNVFTDTLTPDIEQYNKLVPKSERITVKQSLDDLSFEWNIPEEYKSLDVIGYVADRLLTLEGPGGDISLREKRCADELKLYKKLGLFDTLRTLIYIINILEEKNIVWGVGRGSSVSSYVLYIIGVHDVDSFSYNLNIEEFLRT